eukprot:CAMPEP_0184325468 /NCGR_PEP_ID=MMETSP1049-20130417/140491_1 /TAXON_ID=77928 /ORGANISM="Proteomonas sulcata, Strain CCMP704" /LENGTH=97 /DNA_ID=CAMNT_0026647527 /DNA_START=87 /DNA_END=376 /DNA_ORIENTATION=+
MEELETLEVTESGRPALLPNEVELRMEKGVYLYDKDTRKLEDGIAIVTTHRLCWMSEASSKNGGARYLCLPLILVANIQDKSPWMKTSKVCLNLITG